MTLTDNKNIQLTTVYIGDPVKLHVILENPFGKKWNMNTFKNLSAKNWNFMLSYKNIMVNWHNHIKFVPDEHISENIFIVVTKHQRMT